MIVEEEFPHEASDAEGLIGVVGYDSLLEIDEGLQEQSVGPDEVLRDMRPTLLWSG
jgi:hypothetical protein